MKNHQFAIAICLIGVFSLFLPSCNSPTVQPPLPSDSPPSATLSKSATLTHTTLPTETATPRPTSTSTSTSTPSRTSTYLPTLTPLPTLMPAQKARLMYDFGQYQTGCQFPCWWGITPGETSWEAARQKLLTAFTEININKDFSTKEIIVYDVDSPKGGNSSGGTSFEVNRSNNMIESMALNWRPGFQLQQLLYDYGKPDQVVILSPFLWLKDDIPFHMLVYYPQNRMIVSYEYKAARFDDYLQACPTTDSGTVQIWTDENPITLESEIKRLEANENHPWRSIEEVTNYSLESFTETFGNPKNIECIRTSAKYWGNP